MHLHKLQRIQAHQPYRPIGLANYIMHIKAQNIHIYLTLMIYRHVYDMKFCCQSVSLSKNFTVNFIPYFTCLHGVFGIYMYIKCAGPVYSQTLFCIIFQNESMHVLLVGCFLIAKTL